MTQINSPAKKAYIREWEKRNPDKVRAVRLKRRHGGNLEGIDPLSMYHAQAGKCAICDKDITFFKTEGKTMAYLDHCHKTGKIRGFLCPQCNTAIGLLGDTIEGLTKAIEYLAKS